MFWVRGTSLHQGVKEDGRGVEEIITRLSNWEEVIWLVRMSQWILAPQWNKNTPTSGSQWRGKLSLDTSTQNIEIITDQCDKYSYIQHTLILQHEVYIQFERSKLLFLLSAFSLTNRPDRQQKWNVHVQHLTERLEFPAFSRKVMSLNKIRTFSFSRNLWFQYKHSFEIA